MLHSNRLHWPSASSSSGSGSIDFGMCRICRTMTGDWPFKKRFHSFDLEKKEIEFPCFSSNSSSSSTKNTRVRGECTFQLKKCFLFSLPIRRWPFPDWNRTIVELEFTSLKLNEFFRRSTRSDCSRKWSFQNVIELNAVSKQWNWYERTRAHVDLRKSTPTMNERKCIVGCESATHHGFVRVVWPREGKQKERRSWFARVFFKTSLLARKRRKNSSLIRRWFAVARRSPTASRVLFVCARRTHAFVYFSFTLLESNGMCVENRISIKELLSIVSFRFIFYIYYEETTWRALHTCPVAILLAHTHQPHADSDGLGQRMYKLWMGSVTTSV